MEALDGLAIDPSTPHCNSALRWLRVDPVISNDADDGCRAFRENQSRDAAVVAVSFTGKPLPQSVALKTTSIS